MCFINLRVAKFDTETDFLLVCWAPMIPMITLGLTFH